MPQPSNPRKDNNRAKADNRRRFFQRGLVLAGGVVTGSEASIANSCQRAGSDHLRIGLIGAGRQGRATVTQLLQHDGTELAAIGDVFANQIQSTFRSLKSRFPDQISFEQNRFVGLDAYEKVLASNVDLVVLATPPFFRPQHFEASVDAGKHALLEKAVAVDHAGIQTVREAAALATQKNLTVCVAMQRRYDPKWQQVANQILGGTIGTPVLARHRFAEPLPSMTPSKDLLPSNHQELMSRLRRWQAEPWLGGHLLFEQSNHIHDFVNWAVGCGPSEATGTQYPDGKAVLEFHYRNGLQSLTTWGEPTRSKRDRSHVLAGTDGKCDLTTGIIVDRNDNPIWKPDTCQSDQKAIAAFATKAISQIRSGHPSNDIDWGLEGSRTALLACDALMSSTNG